MPSEHRRNAHRATSLSIHHDAEQREPSPPSTPRRAHTNQSVAVAAGGDASYDEIADMVAETLLREGAPVLSVKDGDSQAFEQQVLRLGIADPARR